MFFHIIYSILEQEDDASSVLYQAAVQAEDERTAKESILNQMDCFQLEKMEEVDVSVYNKLPKTPIPTTYIPISIGNFNTGQIDTIYVSPHDGEECNPLLTHEMPTMDNTYVNGVPIKEMPETWQKIMEEALSFDKDDEK